MGYIYNRGQSAIRKRIFDIILGQVRNKTRIKSAILLTDSKGKYISEQISTESFLAFQIILVGSQLISAS
jgi:hypothetical protein